MNLRRIVFACFASAIFVMSEIANAFAGPGAVDTTFNVVVNNPVYSTLVQPDGRILIGGAFNTVSGLSRFGFARLYPDGTLDTSISNVISGEGTIYAMLVQPDGKFILGGSFTVESFPNHNNVVRLNVDGSVDGTFTNSAPNNSVYALALQTDGKILIGGQFTSLANSNHWYVARLNTDGTVDNSFNPGTINGSMVNAITVQGDGNILIGGSFQSFSTYGLTRQNLARLTTNGIPDLSYTATASSTIQAVYLDGSGKSVWVGSFSSLDTTSRSHIGRLNMDGSVDGTLTNTIGPNGTLYAVTEDTNANVYAAGQISEYNGISRCGVARLFPDGTLDTNFNVSSNFPTAMVRSIAIQGDGKVIVGGQFTSFNQFPCTNLVRLYGNEYPAQIITQPKSANVGVGATVTFSVDANNPTAVDYQWFENGVAIPGATDNEYSLFNVQLEDAATFNVYVSTSLGGTTSSNAVLQVGTLPVFTQTPTNLTVSQGQTATFTAAATGTPLNYYWKFGQTLVGTNATLTLTNVSPSQAGVYTVVISNFVGSTNAIAVLSVLYPVTLLTSPQSESVTVGGTASFSVSASGNPIYYQWYKNSVLIPGATSSSYSITNVMPSDAAGYTAVVSNQFSSQSSAAATLTVGYPPTVIVQPMTVTNNLGDTVNFNCTVAGTAPFSFQWLFNGNPLPNQTASNLTLTNVQITNMGNYSVSISSPFGSTTSSNAFLNLYGYPSYLYFGLIAYYPFSGNANDASGNGNNGVVNGATLTQDRFGNPNMAYQFDGMSSYISCNVSNIPTAGSPRTVSLWAQSDMTNTAGANCIWWGTPVYLEGFGIIDDGSPYTWKGQLYGGIDDVDSGIAVDTNWHQIVVAYDGLQFSISIDGALENSLDVFTSTGFSPVIIGAEIATNYFPGAIDEVRIYDRALTTNDVAQLYQFESGMPVIQQQPQSLSLVAGQTANFNVQAISVGSLSYQWYYSNEALTNATNATLSIPAVQATNAGTYYVVVSNNIGSVTSSVASLSVGTAPQMLHVSLGSNGLPVIQMPGTPGFNYIVQATSNLQPPIAWQTIATVPADTNGVCTYMDTNPPAGSARFYRIAAP